MKSSRIVPAFAGCAVAICIGVAYGPAKTTLAQESARGLEEKKAVAREPLGEPIPPPSPVMLPDIGLPPPGPVRTPPATTKTPERDPEKVAQEFVEKNQKVAEAELKALKQEAETLKNRLQKVESAMRRWEAIAHALKQSEGVVSKADGSWKPEPGTRRAHFERDAILPAVDAPTSLEPIQKLTADELDVPAPPQAPSDSAAPKS